MIEPESMSETKQLARELAEVLHLDGDHAELVHLYLSRAHIQGACWAVDDMADRRKRGE